MTEIIDLENVDGGPSSGPVVAFTASRARIANPHPDVIERTRNHVVIVGTSGSGHHMVDFDRFPVEVGTAVNVQPGQVHRFDPDADFEAVAVVIHPDCCPTGLVGPADHGPPATLGPATAIVTALATDLLRLSENGRTADPLVVTTARLLLRHVAVAATVPLPGEPSGSADLVRAFRAELERSHATTRSAAHYASEIGTSTKTLSRATATHHGRSPKEMIDARVALEAKRLLVDTNEPIAVIGGRLGFTEATNFTKFFIRITGLSPHDFRQLPPG
ncbi:MAG: helix-turn-helix domain-containing protein [Acidimicrobiales bacterium]